MKRNPLPVSKGLVIISCTLFAFALILFARYAVNTVYAKKLQQETQEIYSAAGMTKTEEAPLTVATATADLVIQTAPQVSTTAPLNINLAIPNTPIPGMAAQFVDLYKKNSDLVGWLKADAILQVDFPVVQRDNEYYFNRDFYGRKQQSGTVFLDESVSIMPRSKNLILHGHNMKNGTMFGKLYQCLDPGVIASNPLIEFSTLYESSNYVPYAISIVSIDPQSDRYVSLVHGDFSLEIEMLSYVDELRKFSEIQLSVDVIPEDKLLTLITCHGNEEHERLVVALRALRPQEDMELIKQEFYKIN